MNLEATFVETIRFNKDNDVTDCKKWVAGKTVAVGHTGVRVPVQRLAFAVANGVSLNAIHKQQIVAECGNPDCINADHLTAPTLHVPWAQKRDW